MREILKQLNDPSAWDAAFAPPEAAFAHVMRKYLKQQNVKLEMRVMNGGCLYGSISGIYRDNRMEQTQILLNQELSRGPRAQQCLAHELGHYVLHFTNGFRHKELSRDTREVEAELFSLYLYSSYYGVYPQACRNYLLHWGALRFAIPDSTLELIQERADPFLEELFK